MVTDAKLNKPGPNLMALTCTAARRACAFTLNAPLRFDGTSSINRRVQPNDGAAFPSPSRSLVVPDVLLQIVSLKAAIWRTRQE